MIISAPEGPGYLSLHSLLQSNITNIGYSINSEFFTEEFKINYLIKLQNNNFEILKRIDVHNYTDYILLIQVEELKVSTSQDNLFNKFTVASIQYSYQIITVKDLKIIEYVSEIINGMGRETEAAILNANEKFSDSIKGYFNSSLK